MKKIITILLLILTLSLTGCTTEIGVRTYTINYTGEHHKTWAIINSNSDITDFYNDYNEVLGLDYIQDEENSSFEQIMSTYKSDLFETQSLIMVVIETSNSTTTYDITEYYQLEDTYYLTFQEKENESITDNMCLAQLFIITVDKISSDLILDIKVK